MKIRYSETAQADLAEIHSYIAEDNERAADQVIDRILRSIRHLEKFPELGRPGKIEHTRELLTPGLQFVAVYRIEGDVVLILTVFHTRQNWPDGFQ